ncbi:RNA polymerase [Sea otter poxvirus]|uniref:DNA-directed RNA polymerase subunit n=1 Tax=Sea otter poxvirus TaxID=1416741 RepID=A0A2U9QHR7_9POXV|nr:RNA polymerase [Sea otter poxvirus]AWU47112.1 RNA polymerase [Sea otter poxvirus]
MNKYNVTYLSKILCLKAEILRDPFAIISSEVLLRYDINISYGDLVSVIRVIHKIDSSITVFQVFNETTINYTPIDNDYGQPIIITSFLQTEPNKFPISFLYIDVIASDLFPRFKRPTQEEMNIITNVLNTGNKKESLKLPRMLDTEIVAKILYHQDYPLKIVRFFRNNIITGVEIADRSIANVMD